MLADLLLLAAPRLQHLVIRGADGPPADDLDAEPHLGNINAILEQGSGIKTATLPWSLLGTGAFERMSGELEKLQLHGTRSEASGRELGESKDGSSGNLPGLELSGQIVTALQEKRFPCLKELVAIPALTALSSENVRSVRDVRDLAVVCRERSIKLEPTF